MLINVYYELTKVTSKIQKAASSIGFSGCQIRPLLTNANLFGFSFIRRRKSNESE